MIMGQRLDPNIRSDGVEELNRYDKMFLNKKLQLCQGSSALWLQGHVVLAPQR